MSLSSTRMAGCLLAVLGFLLPALPLSAQSSAEGATLPPVTWIDPDTGHRVWRLSTEPDSSGLYFNVNSFAPDKKTVVYIAQDGVHTIDLITKKTRLILPKKIPVIAVGRKTNSLYYMDRAPRDPEHPEVKKNGLFRVALDTGEVSMIAVLPPNTSDWMTNTSINADETLMAGIKEDGPPAPDSHYNITIYKSSLGPDGKPISGLLVQGSNKEEWMESRLNAHIPLTLFTINLKTGELKTVLQSTDWISHVVFSPTDPTLLMYCHEGKWQKVDRLWTIRTDGTENTLLHKRTMVNEVCGHEFWDPDGKTVWYDLQTPSGLVLWLAGYNTETKERKWYHLEQSDFSIHYNTVPDGSLFCGDGCDASRCGSADVGWIKLYHPQLRKNEGINDPSLIRTGNIRTDRLVNMARHNYALEPNVRFSPDRKLVLFTSNMFGPSYYFGVEVEKANPEEKKATP